MPLESCTGGHRASKSFRYPKTVDHSPRKRPEMPEITSFATPQESCTGGHIATKSFREPKTVDHSPRKRTEMPEITSFGDAATIVYRGSQGIEILPAAKNRVAHENDQKCPK